MLSLIRLFSFSSLIFIFFGNTCLHHKIGRRIFFWSQLHDIRTLILTTNDRLRHPVWTSATTVLNRSLPSKIYLRFRSTWTTVRNDRHLSLSLSVIIHVIEIGSVIHANMLSKTYFICVKSSTC